MGSIKIIFCMLAIATPILCNPAAYPNPYAGDEPDSIFSFPRFPHISQNFITKLPATLVEMVPNAGSIMSMTMNTIGGLPFEMAMKTLREFCSAAIKTNMFKPTFIPDVHDIPLNLMTSDGNYTFSLRDVHQLFEHPQFDNNKMVTIYVTGWRTNSNDRNDALLMMQNAYMCRGTHNFIVIDTGRFIDSVYMWTSFNADAVGKMIGDQIVEMTKVIPAEKFHLIGHGIGAHIIGSAGREYFEKTGKQLPRITGLDPSMVCFKRGELFHALQPNDAERVETIHTNNNVLGTGEVMGTVDFYPNGEVSRPPGCYTFICAHHLAVKFYAESVVPGWENNFLGLQCNSIESYRGGRCHGEPIPMGFDTPKSATGKIMLETNGKSPYGKDVMNLHPKCKSGADFHWN